MGSADARCPGSCPPRSWPIVRGAAGCCGRHGGRSADRGSFGGQAWSLATARVPRHRLCPLRRRSGRVPLLEQFLRCGRGLRLGARSCRRGGQRSSGAAPHGFGLKEGFGAVGEEDAPCLAPAGRQQTLAFIDELVNSAGFAQVIEALPGVHREICLREPGAPRGNRVEGRCCEKALGGAERPEGGMPLSLGGEGACESEVEERTGRWVVSAGQCAFQDAGGRPGIVRSQFGQERTSTFSGEAPKTSAMYSWDSRSGVTPAASHLRTRCLSTPDRRPRRAAAARISPGEVNASHAHAVRTSTRGWVFSATPSSNQQHPHRA